LIRKQCPSRRVLSSHLDMSPCLETQEKHRTFDFKGLNKETRLVTPAQYEHGVTVEDHMLRGRTLATSPDQAHF